MNETIILQYFIEELDANCSLLDALQDGFDGPYCNSTTDQIGTCWPRTGAGELVERPCPEFFNGIKYNTTRNAYRECLSNGTWAIKVNYSQCEPILDDETKPIFHYKVALIINYLGHCISVGALVVAFLLFLCLRSIRCLRNIIHWNLITTFILRNVMWFVLQLIDHNIHESNEVLLPHIAEEEMHSFNLKLAYVCSKEPAVSNKGDKDSLPPREIICPMQFNIRQIHALFCFELAISLTSNLPGNTGIPFPIIAAWAVCKLYYENEQCWFGKEPGKYVDYIYQGPVILVLLINFVFLFNIVRILMTKLRASTTSETIQYRKAVKATLVLLPLLGITYMLFFVNPGEDELSQIFFIYFNSFLQSFQGFFVSVFYCFLNGEVRSAARKRWHRWQDHHSLRVRVARTMSIPTSPTRISFHSIKQTASV
ncbi:corticotropin-releasing factor receptor 2-like [Heteronotia binoei]|uniref:corticotropin-releasing factor receptor 2-like n=1 Tax=Heteronotia binoei TaxID=13085 RepID=UPI00292DEAE3|nr:corticotropin-releasing factor receptor 2-like [Heteronotia binoei]